MVSNAWSWMMMATNAWYKFKAIVGYHRLIMSIMLESWFCDSWLSLIATDSSIVEIHKTISWFSTEIATDCYWFESWFLSQSLMISTDCYGWWWWCWWCDQFLGPGDCRSQVEGLQLVRPSDRFGCTKLPRRIRGSGQVASWFTRQNGGSLAITRH